MAQNFLTPDMIAPEALLQFKNSINMVGGVDRQLDEQFTHNIGDAISVRRLTRFEASDGPDVTAAIREVKEGKVIVTLDQFKTVAINITSQELTLDLKSFSEQIIGPAMIELAQQVESSLCGLAEDVWNQVGVPGTTPSTIADALLPRTKLSEGGVPMTTMKKAFYDPAAAGAMAAVLGGVFPSSIATMALEEGTIRRYAGFEYLENQSIIKHTMGVYSGTPLVNGASQNVTYDAVKDTYQQSLITDGWGSGVTSLKKGDRFTIADVLAVNPKTRQSTGSLQQFVVKSDISDTAGAITMAISPPIISSGAFQTVNSAPANDAAITVIGGASGAVIPQNIAMHKNAFTLAMANLEIPMGNVEAARHAMDGISVRVVMDYDGPTDKSLIRFDILYATVAQNPGFAVVHVG